MNILLATVQIVLENASGVSEIMAQTSTIILVPTERVEILRQ